MCRSLLCVLSICLLNFVYGQDVHWSQPYAAPMYENPAQTGFYNGLYRFGGNARMQWSSVTVPYKTISAWTDYNTFRPDKESNDMKSIFLKNDYIGYGFLGYSDRAGDGDLTMNKAYAMVAYHLPLSKSPIIILSGGAAFGFIQKNIDFDKLYFDDQWNGRSFTSDIQTSQRRPVNKIQYFDFNLGVMLSVIRKNGDYINFGYSYNHQNNAQESFVENSNFLGTRKLYHLNGKFTIDPKWQVETEIFYQTQKEALEIIPTTLFGYKSPSRDRVIYHQGLSARYSGDVIAVTGVSIREWRFLVSYDVNVSKLVPASQGRGATEISFVKIGTMPENKRKNMFCPTF